MKKLLIATAALAMVAGTAQAQSSVTVYGILDAGYNSVENTVSGAATTTNAITGFGEFSTSRFGVRGTEDLGGGLKANFVMESTVNANTALTWGGRAFWVGLADANKGEIRLGRQDAFTRSVWLGADQLAAANVAGNLAHDQTITGGASIGSHTGRFESVNYFTPRMSGVQLTAGVMINEVDASTGKSKTAAGSQFGLNYVAGKFTAAAAKVSAKTDTAAGTTATVAISGTACTSAETTAQTCSAGPTDIGGAAANDSYYRWTAASAASSIKTDDTAVAATYDFGFAKVAYIYNKREAINATSAATGNTYRESNAFSASIPLSAKLTARVGYGFGEYGTGATTATMYDTKGMQASLGYELSKRTTAYVVYGDEKRDTSATASTKTKEYSAGVRHSF
jgi:predicted porin